MGLFSAIGSLFGLGSNKKAINTANQQTIAGINNAIGQVNQNIATNTAAAQPYTTAGANATSSIADMLGLNGNDKQSAAIQALQSSPMFTSQYNQGVNTVLQNASATGGLRGGNTQTSLAQFGSNLLDTLIQQQVGNLGGLSGEGLAATQGLMGSNTQQSNSIAQLLANIGQSNASATLAKQGVTNNAMNSVTGFLDGSAQGVGNFFNSGSPSAGNIGNLIASIF